MLKRLDPDLAERDLLARVNANKPCCSGMCLKMLWKGTRQPLTDVELKVLIIIPGLELSSLRLLWLQEHQFILPRHTKATSN